MKGITLQEAMAVYQDTLKGGGVAVNGMGNKVRSKVVYFAGLGTALANKNGNVIDQQTLKAIGVTNSDGGNKLNAGRNLLVTAIRILFDVTSGVATTTALWKGEAPPAFKNGELIISQSGSGNLFESPVGPLAKYSSSLSVEQEFKQITPFLIREQVEYFIQFNLAAAAAADQAFRIELECIEFTNGAVA